MTTALRSFLIAASALVAFSSPAQALTLKLPACSASNVTTMQPGYVSCLGSYVGNMDNQLTGSSGVFAAINSGFQFSTNTYFSSEYFSANGNPFAQNEGSRDDGIINFDHAYTGKFVLGLKQANGFSLYLFNGSNVPGGISQIAYDTNGVQNNGGRILSHAGFFGTPTVSPVPEAGTYGMMLAGLAGLGLLARRRRA